MSEGDADLADEKLDGLDFETLCAKPETAAPSQSPTTEECDDGLRNGDETGVDCGGPSCSPSFAGFEEGAEAAGVDDTGTGMGVAWGDYDGDGALDLYVSNVGGANVLYRNKGDGTFEDATAAAGNVGHRGSGGVAWADYDGDGALDQ